MVTATNGNGKSTALVRAEEPAVDVFVPRSWDQLLKISDVLSRSSLIPKALQGRPGDVAIVLGNGAEMGLSAFQSLRLIFPVDGKPSMAAELIIGRVKQSPVCEYFKLIESTDEIATYETKRRGQTPTKLSFTRKDAETAKLLNKDNWQKYPKAMLRNRAGTALARAEYPEITAGLYDPEELEGAGGPAAESASGSTSVTVTQVVEAKAAADAIPSAESDPCAIIDAHLATLATLEQVDAYAKELNEQWPALKEVSMDSEQRKTFREWIRRRVGAARERVKAAGGPGGTAGTAGGAAAGTAGGSGASPATTIPSDPVVTTEVHGEVVPPAP